jgi:cytochrome c-type biogenesis protein
MVSIFIAILAGMVSFLSPCILPLVPAYMGFVSGSYNKGMTIDRKIVFLRSLIFVLGFSFVFISMGATASIIGKLFVRHRDLFSKVSGMLIIFFGLHISGLLHLSFLNKELRFRTPKKITGSFSSFLLGMAFAAGWTPCVGAVLGSILLYASTSATVNQGILLLTMYSLGLGIPFIITALLTSQINKVLNRYESIFPYIHKTGGFLMVLLGVLIFFNKMGTLSQYFYFFDIRF